MNENQKHRRADRITSVATGAYPEWKFAVLYLLVPLLELHFLSRKAADHFNIAGVHAIGRVRASMDMQHRAVSAGYMFIGPRYPRRWTQESSKSNRMRRVGNLSRGSVALLGLGLALA